MPWFEFVPRARLPPVSLTLDTGFFRVIVAGPQMIRLTCCLYQLDASLQCKFSREGISEPQAVSTDISPNPYGATVRGTLSYSLTHGLFQPCTTGTKQLCRPVSDTYVYSASLSTHSSRASESITAFWEAGRCCALQPSSVIPGLPAESEPLIIALAEEKECHSRAHNYLFASLYREQSASCVSGAGRTIANRVHWHLCTGQALSTVLQTFGPHNN